MDKILITDVKGGETPSMWRGQYPDARVCVTAINDMGESFTLGLTADAANKLVAEMKSVGIIKP